MEQLIFVLFERWLLILLRATLILGPLVAVFWVWKPRWAEKFRIHQPKHIAPIFKQELPRTVLSLSVYLLPITCVILAKNAFGYSRMYLDISQYGWAYFFFSILFFALFYDTWFYWAHRLMHSKRWLKRSHNVHHRSYNVNPVSSYSFDFVESLINMAPYWILVMAVPWHPLALMAFSLGGILFNGYLHLGYDFGPAWGAKHPLFKWMNTATHHSIHHQRYDGNFSVYFTFWDKWMGTEVLPEEEKV